MMTLVSKEGESLFDGEEFDPCLRKDIELFVTSWVKPYFDEVFFILQLSLWCDHELAVLDIIDGYVEIWSAANNYQEFAISREVHAHHTQSSLHFEVSNLLFAWHLEDLTGWLKSILSSSYEPGWA